MNVGLFINIIYGIVFFFTAFAVTYLVFPVARNLSFALRALDFPDGRGKRYLRPIPRLGGIALLVGFLVPCLGGGYIKENVFVSMLFGGAVIVLLGLFDDIRGISPSTRLLVQIIASLSAMTHGVMLESVSFFGTKIELGILSPVLTVILIVLITNSFNFGGRSLGEGAISSLFLAAISAVLGDLTLVGIPLALAGACFGLLSRNFKRKRLSLGNFGGQLIGFVISILIIGILSAENNEVGIGSLLFVVAYPLFETFLGIVRRLKKGKNRPSLKEGQIPCCTACGGIKKRGSLVHRLILGSVLGMSGVCLALGSFSSFVVIMSIGFCIFLCGSYVIFPQSIELSPKKESNGLSNVR